MINICTVSDINYLIKGLTLYESLKKTSDGFVLHYLCIDDAAYDKLKKYENGSLKVYHVNDLIEADIKLKKLKDSEYKYFCWSLASYFSFFLLKTPIESITYIDSDIYFHKNISLILKEIGDREVAIFRHRQFALGSYHPEGLFNVGVIHFKNGYVGEPMLHWWGDAVLNKKYPELATCGDQKYLDKFLEICPADFIYVDGNIGHGAPWQWQLYDFSKYETEGKIIWEGKEQILVFTHFSQFSTDLKTYIPSTMHHIYTPLSSYSDIKELKTIYNEYFNELKKTSELYQ